MKKAVIGIVDTEPQAETVVLRLEAAGFGANEISVLFPDADNAQAFVHEQHTKAPEDPAAGTRPDRAVASGFALLAGVGALAIPGLGLFIGAGTILAGLTGLAAGAVFVGLTGILAKVGVPEYEAKMYEDMLAAGKILIFVHTEDASARKRVADVLKQSGVRDAVAQTEGKTSELHAR